HRGACGCENNTGDGAGVLIQIPHGLLVRRCRPLGIDLPQPLEYGVGSFFASPHGDQKFYGQQLFEQLVAAEGQRMLGWRPLDTKNGPLGESPKAVEPAVLQAFVGWGPRIENPDQFERKLYVIRKRFETAIESSGLDDHPFFYFSSLSCRTVV